VSTWSAAGFVQRLAEVRIGSTFNFYAEGAGAEVRRARLTEYLESRCAASILLVGEAAGYRGARVSGLPFTSERQLTGSGPAEATATIVQGALAALGLAETVLLWNIVPTHPHRPGEPASNRAPRWTEVAAGVPFLDELASGRRVLAIGRLAERALEVPYVRHPSRGGATAFRAGLIELVHG
jgi:Uracil DNA glycosylase superfamily